MTTIAVEYPSTIKVVTKTEAEMRALGYKNYKGDKTTNLYVNRTHRITVKQVSRKIQEEFMTSADYRAELEAMCLAQTGMTQSAYQTKYHRSWNE